MSMIMEAPELSKPQQQWARAIENANSIEELRDIIESIRPKHNLPLCGSLVITNTNEAREILAELHLLQMTANRMRTLVKQGKIRRPQ